jgi:transposase
MNPIPDIEPLFEAAQVFPDPDSAPTPSSRCKAHPASNAPLRFRHIERNQPSWMVVDLERMLDESHPARSIWEFVGGLDLSRFEESVKVKVGGAGRDSWPPRLLISMWIYAYTRGVSSARELERQCHWEPGFQWLTGLQKVNHHTLSDFRVEHAEAMKELFHQVLTVLMMKGLVTLERVTLDGTKVRAHVNKKTFSKPAKLRAYQDEVAKHIAAIEADEARQELNARQNAARKRAARERAQRVQEALEEAAELAANKKWEKEKEASVSRTDPDAHFMKTNDHGLAPAYNVQLVTDAANGLIVDVAVSTQPSDAAHLMPAIKRVEATTGRLPGEIIADGDYTNRKSIIEAADKGVAFIGSWGETTENKPGRGIDPRFAPSAFEWDQATNEVVCPMGKRLVEIRVSETEGNGAIHVYAATREDCQACKKRKSCTPNNKMEKHGRAVSIRLEDDRVDAFLARMETDEATTIYKQRAPIAEFPHAWIKTKLNWTRVRSRGLKRVAVEAIWPALTYNLQRYFAITRVQAQKA